MSQCMQSSPISAVGILYYESAQQKISIISSMKEMKDKTKSSSKWILIPGNYDVTSASCYLLAVPKSKDNE